MLEGDLKWGALRAADGLILPSHQENYGMVVQRLVLWVLLYLLPTR